jgi:hypothetical protein
MFAARCEVRGDGLKNTWMNDPAVRSTDRNQRCRLPVYCPEWVLIATSTFSLTAARLKDEPSGPVDRDNIFEPS